MNGMVCCCRFQGFGSFWVQLWCAAQPCCWVGTRSGSITSSSSSTSCSWKAVSRKMSMKQTLDTLDTKKALCVVLCKWCLVIIAATRMIAVLHPVRSLCTLSIACEQQATEKVSDVFSIGSLSHVLADKPVVTSLCNSNRLGAPLVCIS